jgi:hypothetical protein
MEVVSSVAATAMVERVVLNALLTLGGAADYFVTVFGEADPPACCCVAPFFSSATFKTSSTFSTGTNLSVSCFLRDIDEIFSLSLGMMTVEISAASPQGFFLQTADRRNQAAQSDFAGHGNIWSHRCITK